jgi:hypothetical protein
VSIAQVCQPHWNLAGFRILEQLMDTAAAQARCRGDLPDGAAGVRRSDDGPDPLLFSLMQPCRCQTQAFFGLLFVLGTLSTFFSGAHTLRIHVYG